MEHYYCSPNCLGGGDCPVPDFCKLKFFPRQGIFSQDVLRQNNFRDPLQFINDPALSSDAPENEPGFGPSGSKDHARYRSTLRHQNLRSTFKEQIWRPAPYVMPKVPSLVVSEDDTGPFISNTSHSNLDLCDGKVIRDNLWMADSRYYNQNRGPILRVVGSKTEVVLTYKEFMKMDESGIPMDNQHEDFTEYYPEVEDLFICDDLEQFSGTRKCKQVKIVIVRNEGSTAIRYQWLRAPPTRAMRKILGRPGCILNLSKLEPPGQEPFFWKDTTFEFHFRELPGIILPGQCMEFPIIFRPGRNGYFHEHVYLLTHPRLTNEDDQLFKIRLCGISMDPDCVKVPEGTRIKSCNKTYRVDHEMAPEKLIRQLDTKMKQHEAQDAVNAILDSVLYAHKLPKSTLPNGKVTHEKIFYVHNPSLTYRFGVSEKALLTVRSLASKFVPKDRIINNDQVCPLSISKLYLEIVRQPVAYGYFKENLKLEGEQLFAELNENTKKMVQPRVFGWSSMDSVLYSSCYNTMVSMMDDIMFRIANIDRDSKNVDLNKVLRTEVREKLRKRKMKELGMHVGVGDTAEDNELDAEQASDPIVFPSEIMRDSLVGDALWTTRRTTTVVPESSGNLTAPVDPLYPRDLTPDPLNSLENEYGDEESASLEDLSTEYYGEDGTFPRKSVIEIDEEEIDAELHRMKTYKEAQSRRILFETLFGCGMERMMSVVDAHRAMIPYAESDAIRRVEGICSKL